MIPSVEERRIRPCIILNPDVFVRFDFKCYFCVTKDGDLWCNAFNCLLKEARCGCLLDNFRKIIYPRCGNANGTCDINYTPDEYHKLINAQVYPLETLPARMDEVPE
jgi:hypothetical protein